MFLKNMRNNNISHRFTKLEFEDVKKLKVGEEIVICVNGTKPSNYKYFKAKVVRSLFWNSDADEPEWELETTDGFVDVNSVWKDNY